MSYIAKIIDVPGSEDNTWLKYTNGSAITHNLGFNILTST